jgi:hypothetical protein
MQANRNVLTQEDEVDARLKQLGLSRSILLTAAGRGLAGFAACTLHHPRNYPALASWAEAIRGLRDLLVVTGFGWTPWEENGQPQVINPSGTIALTVAGGDKNTGRIGDDEPRTSASKGHTTAKALAANGYLFPEMETDVQERIAILRNRRTWFLLIHRDISAGKMRCELSLPISMAEDRHIDGWAERIILPETDFDAASLIGIPDEPLELTEEIQLDIKRRA